MRLEPRIEVDALCWELIDGREASALVLDLSPWGARIERPFVGGPTPHDVPLQLEVPGFDEVMWARAQPMSDHIVQRGRGLMRRTGYRIVAAAMRDLRMLREYVMETSKQRGGDLFGYLLRA
jgi:hypothetical protein